MTVKFGVQAFTFGYCAIVAAQLCWARRTHGEVILWPALTATVLATGALLLTVWVETASIAIGMTAGALALCVYAEQVERLRHAG